MSGNRGGGCLRQFCYWMGILVTAVFHLFVAEGQSKLGKCAERPTLIDPPWIDGQDWCLEEVIHEADAGELAFTALVVAPDGRLYAARPYAGQIWALSDSDGDGLPETLRLFADGLTLPNGLAYHNGALYVSGGANLYRISEGEVEMLVDDLPSGGGFWTGGLTIGPDERLYVAIGAPCDFCQPDDPARGAVWSYALDGSDGQQVAKGLRQPADVAFLNGELWTLDTAQDGATGANLDELNLVSDGAHFGWPYCGGEQNQPDWAAEFDCGQAVAPALAFPTHSTPIGLAAYTSATFPKIQGSLLVTLYGNQHQSTLEGYALVVAQFDESGAPVGYRQIIPEESGNDDRGLTAQDLHYQESGFWPHRPLDVAVSPEGWIYVSVGGGRILALRPLG